MSLRTLSSRGGLGGNRWLAPVLASVLAWALSAAVSPPLLAAAHADKPGPPAPNPTATAASLRAEADHYRQIQGKWRAPTAGVPLRPGDRGERVAQLRQLLQLYGDYRGLPGPLDETTATALLPELATAPPDDPEFYGGALQRAVENYQRRHGLTPSGTADAATLTELAVPPQERARQLDLNAERWAKLKLPDKGRYVLINIPAYRLQLVEGGRVSLAMKTVVGKTSSRTPNMTSRITNIVFNPTWTVPRSILLTQLLPKARDNPQAMHRRGYRVVQYRSGKTTSISEDSLARAARGHATLRQISGPGNALGRVKFVIPNNESIFLHDTQAQSLFQIRERAFSHGCVRLERPEELAYALLGTQGWDRVRVAEATTGDEQLNIRVDKPPRLFITYLTAWLDGDGRPQFRRDIYRLDDQDR